MSIVPVCNMEVVEGEVAGTSVYKSTPYFCAAGREKEFDMAQNSV